MARQADRRGEGGRDSEQGDEKVGNCQRDHVVVGDRAEASVSCERDKDKQVADE